jgi:hypothetical protein
MAQTSAHGINKDFSKSAVEIPWCDPNVQTRLGRPMPTVKHGDHTAQGPLLFQEWSSHRAPYFFKSDR